MSSLNRVMIIGNLGRDPEVKSLQDGTRLCNLSVATSESWTDKNTGERRERTEWHRVVIWVAGLVDVAEKYLAKGSKVYLEGQLETRKWQDQSGNDRYSTEVVLRPYSGKIVLLGERQSAGNGAGERRQDTADDYRAASGGGAPSGDIDDEIPF